MIRAAYWASFIVTAAGVVVLDVIAVTAVVYGGALVIAGQALDGLIQITGGALLAIGVYGLAKALRREVRP